MVVKVRLAPPQVYLVFTKAGGRERNHEKAPRAVGPSRARRADAPTVVDVDAPDVDSALGKRTTPVNQNVSPANLGNTD